jgi:nucleotide-binding universal stress UspA family protein
MSEHIEPGSIVVAVDGSPHAERAVAWAATEARLEHRPLVVVAATDPSNIRAAGWAGTAESVHPFAIQQLLESTRTVAEGAAEIARRLEPGVPVTVLPTMGDPRGVLIEMSDRVPLIVLGSRGRGTVRSMLLGSVSAAVCRHAACPVVVCRPTADGRARSTGRGVVVGADGTPESAPVIEFAFERASLRDLPLTVVHCFWDVAAASAEFRRASDPAPDIADRDEMRAMLSASVAELTRKFPDVPVSLEVADGLIDQAILGPDHDWDLVVVGRHPLRSLRRWATGSISTVVVERARATVAVVPEADPASDR